MRVIGEIPHEKCKISIFQWNQKYLVKLEQGMCEQTFKVDSLDVASVDDLKALISKEFVGRALERFDAMNADLLGLLDQ